jgi:glycosyltransferase involved in cell wall biosynthesis
MPKLSIIVPALNEQKTIGLVVEKLLNLDLLPWNKEIIVVNDGSTDDTEKEIQPFLGQIIYLKHPSKQGKGASIKDALGRATGNAVIVQDADLEYDPAEFPVLLKEFSSSRPAIYGSRNLKPKRRGYFHYVLGVKVLTDFTNLLFHSKLTDIYTCYKLLDLRLIKSLGLASSGFEFEAEVTAKILKLGITIKEVPINYYPRSFEEGKKIRAQDALKGFLTILYIKFGQQNWQLD